MKFFNLFTVIMISMFIYGNRCLGMEGRQTPPTTSETTPAAPHTTPQKQLSFCPEASKLTPGGSCVVKRLSGKAKLLSKIHLYQDVADFLANMSDEEKQKNPPLFISPAVKSKRPQGKVQEPLPANERNRITTHAIMDEDILWMLTSPYTEAFYYKNSKDPFKNAIRLVLPTERIIELTNGRKPADSPLFSLISPDKMPTDAPVMLNPTDTIVSFSSYVQQKDGFKYEYCADNGDPLYYCIIHACHHDNKNDDTVATLTPIHVEVKLVPDPYNWPRLIIALIPIFPCKLDLQ